MTQAEYARKRGVSREAIRKAIQSGRIPALSGGRIDPKKADTAFRENTDPVRGGKRAARDEDAPGGALLIPGTNIPKHYVSKAKREQHMAARAKLEHEELAGQLVRTDSIRQAAFAATRRARDQILRLSDVIVPRIIGVTDELEMRKVIDDEARKICEELSTLSPEDAAPAADAEAS